MLWSLEARGAHFEQGIYHREVCRPHVLRCEGRSEAAMAPPGREDVGEKNPPACWAQSFWVQQPSFTLSCVDPYARWGEFF